MAFEDLALLAEASEKYEVFSAIGICRLRMKLFLPHYVHEIMNHAVKHDCRDIIHEAAPVLTGVPLHITASRLPSNIILLWVLYHEKWNEVLRKAVSPSDGFLKDENEYFLLKEGTGTSRVCRKCQARGDNFILDIVQRMNSVQSLRNLDSVFTKIKGCMHTLDMAADWRDAIEQDIRGIQSFVTFL